MLYSIGHSTRSIEEFLGILKTNSITILADVRSMPGSRKYPHFDQETLQIVLQEHGIDYIHLACLGGRRKKWKDADPSINNGWNKGGNNYADYAYYSPDFQEGLDTLVGLGINNDVAFMCSEAVPWRCHRAVITDWLILTRGMNVRHLITEKSYIEGRIHKHGILKEGKVIYPKL